MAKGLKKYYTESENRISVVLWTHLIAGDLSEMTVTQICREAGVSRDTFYRHFSNPEQALAASTSHYHLSFIRRNMDERGDFSQFLASSVHEVHRDNILLKYMKPLLTSGMVDLDEQLVANMEGELLRLGYFAPVMNSARFGEREKALLTHAYCTEYLSVMKYWTQHPDMTETSVHHMLLLLYNRLIQA